MVITVSTRNRVASKIARGFESHRLRQKQKLCPCGRAFVFRGGGDENPRAKRAANERSEFATSGVADDAKFGSESHRLRQNKEFDVLYIGLLVFVELCQSNPPQTLAFARFALNCM